MNSVASQYTDTVLTNPRSQYLRTSINFNGTTLTTPTAGSNGRCIWGTVYVGIDKEYSECATPAPDSVATNSPNSLLSIQTFITLYGNNNVIVYDVNGTIITPNPTTSCPTSPCTQVVNYAVRHVTNNLFRQLCSFSLTVPTSKQVI
jgi:hypothetical protein